MDNNYEIIEVIHTSNKNETIVLKVKEKNRFESDKVYALKLVGSLDNRLQKLIFKREIEALRKLNACENIAKIRDHKLNVEFNNKKNWGEILLDYVYGDNLDNINLNGLPQIKRYEICLKILKAVEDAHNYGVLHRDIKPSNIMYDEETDEVTIIDFGASKIKSCIEEETTLPFFSTNYSAPEIVKGSSSTEASDIYSLGAVIFKILFGITPQGTNMINKTLEEMEIQQELQDLISNMVVESVEERIQDVGEVIEQFEKIMGANIPVSENYLCTIDSEKLLLLKKKLLIENDATMSIFVNYGLRSSLETVLLFWIKNLKILFLLGKRLL